MKVKNFGKLETKLKLKMKEISKLNIWTKFKNSKAKSFNEKY